MAFPVVEREVIVGDRVRRWGVLRALTSLAAITAGASLVSGPAVSAAGHVRTPRGAEIPVIVDAPSGARTGTPAPALVIAPGQAYPSTAPLIASLASLAVEAGFVAVRFDWAYTASGGAPSRGLADEREDLESVLRSALADPRIDASRVFLAGKSLGSIVAYGVFRRDPQLRAFLLLTPVGVRGRGDDGRPPDLPRVVLEENYPKLAEETRPIVITVGDHDPLCPPSRLIAYLAEIGADRVYPLVVPGDHGLRIGDSGHEAANADNVAAVARMNVQWIRALLDR